MANALLLPPLPFSIANGVWAAPGFPLSNVANDYAGVVFRSNPGDPTLIFDFGRDVPIDTVMLFGLWGDIRAAAWVRVVLATSAQGPGFDVGPTDDGTGVGRYWDDPRRNPPFAGSAPIADGNGVFLWRAPADVPRPAAVRYLYLHFAEMEGGYIQFSRLAAGTPLRLERNFSLGGNFGVRDLGSLDFSPRGVLLRRRSRKLRTAGLTFSSIHRDEVEKQTAPLLERIGNTEMVALVTDPDEHPDRQRRCYFGPLVGDLGHVQRRADGFEAKVNMVSIF